MAPIPARIQLERLHCFDEADSIGKAEPYLWAVFFKIDGTTAVVNQGVLEGTAQTFNSLGDHGNLGTTSVDAGDDVRIPQQFGFGGVFTPIPLRPPLNGTSEAPWIMGCAVVLLEQDNTPGSAVAHGRAALRIEVQEAIDQVIPTLNVVHQTPSEEELEELKENVSAKVTAAVANHVSALDWLSGFGNMDDLIGSEVFIFTQSDFFDAGPEPIKFRSAGTTRVTGRFTVTPGLNGPPGETSAVF